MENREVFNDNQQFLLEVNKRLYDSDFTYVNC